MAKYRVFEVQVMSQIKRWYYNVEAESEGEAIIAVQAGEYEPEDDGYQGEPDYGESGYAVRDQDFSWSSNTAADSPYVAALANLEEKISVSGLTRFIVVGVDIDRGEFFMDHVAARDSEEAESIVMSAREYADDCEAFTVAEWSEIAETIQLKSIGQLRAEMAELAGTENGMEEPDHATPES